MAELKPASLWVTLVIAAGKTEANVAPSPVAWIRSAGRIVVQ